MKILAGLILFVAAPLAMGADTTLPSSATGPATAPVLVPVPVIAKTAAPTTVPALPTTRAVVTATTSPAESPTTQRSSTPPSRVMSSEFSVLTQRSIFLKGRQRVEDESSRRSWRDSSSSREMIAPEHSIVFNGATDADDDLVAFLEDTTTGRVTKMHVGDRLAEGKITGITLDSLNYDAHGRVTEVVIGHNLEGEILAAPAPAPTTGPAVADTGSTTGPSTAPAPTASGPPSSTDDIAERMRQRRLQLMGKK